LPTLAETEHPHGYVLQFAADRLDISGTHAVKLSGCGPGRLRALGGGLRLGCVHSLLNGVSGVGVNGVARGAAAHGT